MRSGEPLISVVSRLSVAETASPGSSTNAAATKSFKAVERHSSSVIRPLLSGSLKVRSISRLSVAFPLTLIVVKPSSLLKLPSVAPASASMLTVGSPTMLHARAELAWVVSSRNVRLVNNCRFTLRLLPCKSSTPSLKLNGRLAVRCAVRSKPTSSHAALPALGATVTSANETTTPP